MVIDLASTFSAILDLVDNGKPLPHFAIKGTLRATTSVIRSELTSQNIAAIYPGSDPVLKNEYVVMSGHVDHLGVGTPVNGDAIFNGAMDRYFRAFDQADGKVLWETRLGSQIMGTPVTFSVAGRQYVAVAAGGGYNTISPQLKPELDQVAGGNMVYVFALPEAGK